MADVHPTPSLAEACHDLSVCLQVASSAFTSLARLVRASVETPPLRKLLAVPTLDLQDASVLSALVTDTQIELAANLVPVNTLTPEVQEVITLMMHARMLPHLCCLLT